MPAPGLFPRREIARDIFGGGGSAPKPSPPPPPLPPPTQVADPSVFQAYRTRVGTNKGMASTVLTGGIPSLTDNKYTAPSLGRG